MYRVPSGPECGIDHFDQPRHTGGPCPPEAAGGVQDNSHNLEFLGPLPGNGEGKGLGFLGEM